MKENSGVSDMESKQKFSQSEAIYMTEKPSNYLVKHLVDEDFEILSSASELGIEESIGPSASPTDSVPLPPKYKCEMCGKEVKLIHTHHALPRFCRGDDRDMMNVCPRCHKKADAAFIRLYIDPWGEKFCQHWTNPKTSAMRATARNLTFRRKHIQRMALEDCASLIHTIFYNKYTHEISFRDIFYYRTKKTRDYERTNKTKVLFHMPVEPWIYVSTVITHRMRNGKDRIVNRVAFRRNRKMCSKEIFWGL